MTRLFINSNVDYNVYKKLTTLSDQIELQTTETLMLKDVITAVLTSYMF